MDFTDRFNILYSSINPNTLDTLTDQQLEQQYPVFAEMVQSVKRHSVLLTKKSRAEIYYAITHHADPKIGLVLAAARDKSGNQIFATTEIVNHFMFAETTDQIQKSNVDFRDKVVFVDGIKRVSTALAAALLIGQLAQVPEQQKHSEYLEKQALLDLDRILQVPELSDLLKADTINTTEQLIKSFYFKPGTYKIIEPLTMEVFISGANNWILVDAYFTEVNTATLIADLADAINSFSLASQTSNLVAAPVLASENDLHRLDFSSRRRDLVVSNELVSVRFTQSTSNLNIPFLWGISEQSLSNYYLNSLILTTQVGKVTSLLSSTLDEETKLNVLYFKYRDDLTATTDEIEYRISPTMDDSRYVVIDPVYANDKATGATIALLNDLFEDKANNNVLGSILQNDPNTNSLIYSGIKLVAYIISHSITEYILDIISLPEDLEIALGNKLGPITSFSNKPRSLTIEAYYEKELANSINSLDNLEGKTLLVKSKQSKVLQRMQDIREAQYLTYGVRNYQFPIMPPNTYHPNQKDYL